MKLFLAYETGISKRCLALQNMHIPAQERAYVHKRERWVQTLRCYGLVPPNAHYKGILE
jgi:hypothetical protein